MGSISLPEQIGFDLSQGDATLVDVLRERAEKQPDQRVFTFLVDGETEEATLTFHELDRRARAIAAMLAGLELGGQRALLLYAPGLDYVAGVLGCLYAGVVAVPVYPPDFARLGRTLPRVQAIANDAHASVVLTSTELLALADPILAVADELRALRWLSTDTVPCGAERDWKAPAIDGRSLALIQYTSGSTRAPRGVMLSHANLLDNVELLRRATDVGPGIVGVSWLPPYHDMGLVGNILTDVYAGSHLVMMSPVAFLQRPFRWLRALSRYRAYVSGAPNFAYDLCVRKTTPEDRATLDLRSWRVAFCAAEPIRRKTLEEFATAFEDSGFRKEALFPAYGLAEATLVVSAGPTGTPPIVRPILGSALERDRLIDAPSEHPGARHVVSCGAPLLDVAVVDPETRRRCPPDQIGEVWVSGPSVADGYWGRPEETAEAFRALIEDTGEGPFLRTGDLGFVRDGQLFITGRLKDVIILHGANHYPQDIELTAEQSHPGLRRGCGAAFSVDVAGEEGVALVYEVDTRPADDWEALGRAVRRAVLDEHLVDLHALSFVAHGSVPKTSSGKIQRHACKAEFLAGTLDTMWEWRAVGIEGRAAPVSHIERLEAELRSRVATELDLDPSRLDVDEAVAAYGLDSVKAASLAYEIETHYGVELPTTLPEGVSISRLAREILRLEEAAQERPTPQRRPPDHVAADHSLSHGERALWFLDQLAPGSVAYHLVHAFRVLEKLDAAALERAVDRLVTRHAPFRTSYVLEAGEPIRKIHARAEDAFRAFDATRWTPAELDRRVREEAYHPFDLARAALFRVRLFRRADEDVLVVALHHIVADWWSVAVIARDLEEFYRAEREDRAPSLPPLTSEYADYVSWQAELLDGPDGERLCAFWRQKLAGASGVLHLSTDRPRPAVQTSRGSTYAFRLSHEITTHLQGLARSGDATLYMTLVAALQVLLHRYTGQHDVVIGSPMLGRRHGAFAGLVGYFVNPVVLGADLTEDPPFETFLQAVRRTVIDAIAHQDFPFSLLVERLRPVRDPSRSPLLQVMFEWLGDPWKGAPALSSVAFPEMGGRLSFAGMTFDTFPLERQGSQLDLTLRMAVIDHRLSGAWQYNTDIFDAATIERLHENFATLLEGIATDPRQRVGSIPLITPAERHRILVEWNDTSTPAPPDRCLHELFETRAARGPDRTAIVFEDHRLSYGELDRRADRVANHLHRLGIGPEQLVGLLVERSADMVIALLGILKAGAAYVPLDPSYPLERLTAMLEDAQVSALLTTTQSPEQFLARGTQVVRLGEMSDDTPGRLAIEMTTENLAYVIYTSGSTGRPKGVEIPHRGLVNCLTAMAGQLDLTERDVFLAVTSLSFDIAALELLLPLVTGGTVVIVPRETVADGRRLAARIARSGATFMQATPSTWRMLVESGWKGNPELTVLCGGDTLPRDLADRLCARAAAVWNLYGPTETTIWSSIHRVTAGSGAVPIGRPIANTELYVLDPRLQPVPVGVVGELHIGGVGLARGYHGQSELTAERFIPHPFSGERGARLYKTGDLARYLPDGSLEYLGRRDQQVKVRGFRVELGEIEAAISQHPAVRQAVVALRGDAVLVAYVVARGGEVPAVADLKAFLRKTLPSYMVPSGFVFLEEMPLLPTGKIDRAALPRPPHRGSEGESASPRTSLERLLVTLWADVLAAASIGRDDDFFDLGGHSLQAARLAARVSDATGRAIPVQFILCHPTPAAAAAALEAEVPGPGRSLRSPSESSRVGAGTPSLVTIEHRPLLSLVAAGRIPPVDAAALAYFPRALLSDIGVTAEDVVQTWCGGLPLVAAIDDTPVGRLAMLVLPRFDAELYADPDDLARIVREATTTAASLGARTVALTGLLASALDYGRTVTSVGASDVKATITTGHATTSAAVVLTIGEILQATGRDLAAEQVAFLGLGSIGAAALQLMLVCLPHPLEIVLCDTFGKRERLEVLERSVREQHGFRGTVRLAPSRGAVPPELYRASLIVGATNVPDLIDVDRLRAGTLIVDDSAPHCFRPSDAFRRLEGAGDILFAEGGVLTAPRPIPQLRYLPQSLAPFRQSLVDAFPVADDRHAIPACMLSALLSARFPELPPTLGPVEVHACVEHYRALERLGFVATTLRCGRRVLDDAAIGRFRSSFGHRR